MTAVSSVVALALIVASTAAQSPAPTLDALRARGPDRMRRDEVSPVVRSSPVQRPDVPYVPTPQNVVEAMLDLAHVAAGDVVYDLGSGDGRIPITAAAKYGARGVGIEIDMFHLRDALDNVVKAGVADRVRFIHGDLFATNISEATVVTYFLLPHLNERLIAKFRSELRPGTRIVSHAFDLGDAWPPDETREINGLRIFRWTIR